MVNFFIILVISQIATQLTHTLAFEKNMGSVRASSLLTLFFIGLTYSLSFEIIPTLQAVFLGSSFIGMSDPIRLSRKQLFFASLIFCLIFQFLIFYFKGLGGTLGFSAFVSCLFTHVIWTPVKRRFNS